MLRIQCLLRREGGSRTVWYGKDKAYLSEHVKAKVFKNVQIQKEIQWAGGTCSRGEGSLPVGITRDPPCGLRAGSRSIKIAISKAIQEGSKTQREKSEKNKREDTFCSHIVVPRSLQLCSHSSGQRMPGVGAILKILTAAFPLTWKLREGSRKEYGGEIPGRRGWARGEPKVFSLRQ